MTKSIHILDGLSPGLRVLDFYAGEAKWITPILKRFNAVDLWEIQSLFREALEGAIPHANVTIGDSYAMAQYPENRHRFDLILMDNHVGAAWGHVEHFDAVGHVPALLDEKGGYLVVNVCTRPRLLLGYNYLRNYRALWENTRLYWRKTWDGTFTCWLAGRVAFYGCESVTQEQAVGVYSEYFANRGFAASGFRWEERRPFLYLLRMRLTRLD